MKKYNQKEELVKLMFEHKMSKLIDIPNNKTTIEMLFICYLKKKINKKELESILCTNLENINYKILNNFDIDKIYLGKKNNYKINCANNFIFYL